MSKRQIELLNWTPGAGIVVQVDPGLIPRFNLPVCAVPIHHQGRPAYHVTLIKRRAIEHCTDAMVRVWPGILAEPPEVPLAEPRDRLIEAEDPASGARSWIVELHNAEAYEELRRELTERLEQAFDDAGFIDLRVGENPIRWHITLANNRGGDPFQSLGNPFGFLKEKET